VNHLAFEAPIMPATQLDAVVLHIRKLACKATTGSLPDGQLLERFTGQRDESAFAAIVHRHGPMVLGVCRSVLHNWHDAEDAFQATFLVLARKAASIDHPGALGSWLYGVAYHVAIKAQARAARRRDHERRKTTMPAEDLVLDMTVRELRRALYEELERLPQNLKQPLVLCYLESMTHEDAARQLGWSKGKLRGRLNRGREVLRARMARRGLAFSGGLFATVLAHNVARAAVPAAIVARVVETSLVAAAGSATANVVSAEVGALADGVTRAAFMSKLKLVAMLSLALVFAAAGAGAMTFRQSPAAGAEDRTADFVCTATPSDKAPPAAAGKPDKLTGTVEVSGRVLDPEGKPVAGARLYCQLPTFRDEKPAADP
jgi:RNA polymerase sigma factor (sigma-70 family)